MLVGCGLRLRKCLCHRHFLEEGDGENLEQSVEGGVQGKALLDDCDENIDRNRDPDLGFHGIVGGAVELLDPQMLLDPFEEQLDLSTAFVESADRGRGQCELVGEKHQCLF